MLRRKRQAKDLVVGVAWPGKRFQFELPSTSTVAELKEHLHQAAQVPVEVQMFTYRNKILKDHHTLAHYKIKNDSTVLLTRLSVDIRAKPKPKPSPDPGAGEAGKNGELLEVLSLPGESNRYSERPGIPAHSDREPSQPQQPNPAAQIDQFLTDYFSPKAEGQSQPQPQPQPQQPAAVAGGDEDKGGEGGNGVAEEAMEGAGGVAEEGHGKQEEAGEQEKASEQDAGERGEHARPEVVVDAEGGNVFQRLLGDDVSRPLQPPPDLIDKEEHSQQIQFSVKCGKKDVKVKLSANQDLWAVKLKLEAAKMGNAGQMVLFNEDGEELDEDGTLEENDIEDGCRITMHLSG